MGIQSVEVDDRRERVRDVSKTIKQNDRWHGDSIIRKVDKVVTREEDITVCLPGAK